MEVEALWNGWKIDSLIGEGSFGKVYKIVRQEFGYTYYAALKIIEIPQNQSELDSVINDGMDENSVTMYFKSMVEDIVEEFVLMSKLKGNSNIVSYEDHAVVPKKDNFGWKIYIRMELLTPLFQYVKKHTLSTREVIQLGIDICQALEMCRKYNIIHRDIKPENIFISDFGKFKLGDFGIARQMEKTSSGLSKKGTYTYMAPEVYKGLKYNSTVDIYSLGIVLYRFLNNNRTPFMPPAPQPIRYEDRENAIIMRMSGKEIPAPCNADEKLAEIVLKACAYNPEERYASVSEMKNALISVLNSQSFSDNEKEKKTAEEGEHFVSESSAPDSADQEERSDGHFSRLNSDGTISLFRLSKEEKQKLQKEKEERLRKEEERLRREEEEKRREEEKQRHEEEEKRRKEEEEKKRREEEERRRKEEEERRCREEEERRRKEEEEKKRREEEERCRKEEEEKKRREEEERCRKEEEEKKRREEEERRRREEEKQRREEEKRQKEEAIRKQKEERKRQKEERKKDTDASDKKRILVPAAAIAVCIGVVGSIGFYQQSLKCTVPSVVNLTVQAAEELLNNENLVLSTVKEEYSDTFEEGRIISQDHEKGENVRKNTEIGVVVSKGIMLKTPELKGMTQDEAVDKLKAMGVNLQVTGEEYSDSIKKGKIISQDPDFDSELSEGDVVKVIVSKGEEQITMPSVVGREEKEAGNILKDLQLSYKTKEEYSDDIKKGIIISQDIKSGTNVKKDAVITLTISKGKKETKTTKAETVSSQSSRSSSEGSSSQNSRSSSGGSSSQNSGSSSGESNSQNSESSSGESSSQNSESSSGESSQSSGSSPDEEVVNSWDDPDEEIVDSWDNSDEEIVNSWD